MKSKLLSLVISVFLTTTLLSGCTKETTTPDPSPSDARSNFLGNWSVNETWTKLTYSVTISADPNSSDGVFISNFANSGTFGSFAGASVSGTVISLDPDQTIGDGWIINGGGSLSGTTKINWNYTINDGATLIYATAVYTKL